MKLTETDVLVIGSGAAGFYAAIRAAESGMRITLWEKGLAGRSGGTVSGAGPSAYGSFSDPDDSADSLFRDTVEGGSYLSDQPLVRILADEARLRIQELEDWGIRFDKNSDGSYLIYTAGGHSYPRVMAISDRVGLQMSKVLRTKLHTFENVTFGEDTLATKILVNDGQVSGAVGVDFRNGETVCMQAPSVILATGGVGQLYPVTSNPIQVTGDGMAIAYEAGANLINMEQVQFFPCGIVYPPSLQGFILGIQEYAKLYNSKNERFMEKYEPEKLELTTRDRLARGIHSEITAGRGTEHGGVWLDAMDLDPEIYKSFLHEIEVSAERGYDYRKQRLEIAPSVHYFMGGVEIDTDTSTSLPGLFAAGECSGGLQGGNRLSGNALSELLVFGSRAGAAAVKHAKEATNSTCGDQGQAEEDRIIKALNRPKSEITPNEGKKLLRTIMAEYMGVTRTGKGLQKAAKELRKLKEILPTVYVQGSSLQFNQSLQSYLELEKMVTISQTMVAAATIRKESRGAHYREDYPEWDRSIAPQCTLACTEGQKPVIKTRPVKMTEMTPEQSA
ncbi:FAD-dependent oxidoreductase [uncultured Desulfuromusa sp.]|uniref:FAD-dependent oxidoreductase n=1 Tax=uncultured Desulfuromusa sp. TaxID=219183 RepID=UPI002AA92AC2|nr:FAD-dependent oxidoreductase [uncultured Desulfuromusa sp.]